MSDRLTRILAVTALVLALVAVAISVAAHRAATDRLREIEHLRGVLEGVAATPHDGRPSLSLDPGDDP